MTTPDPENASDDQHGGPLDDIDAEAVEDLDVDEDAEGVKGGPYVTDPTCGPECRPR